MALQSTRKSALVDQVIEQLRQQISDGEWGLGSRIPTESELAELLGVGRNTIREGVRALAHAGLLEIRQGAGTFVVGRSEVTAAVRRRIAASPASDAMEVRRGLEVEASRLAAQRRDEADITRLRILLAEREATHEVGDTESFIAADIALHQAIAEASHNKLLAELYTELADSLRETVRAAIGEDLAEDPHIDHTRAVEAIIAGDADLAAAETAAYLRLLIDD
ncbi:FadR/GntR family transcriptional regulator [Glycomyces sp. NRRL B-16210]|uniref:FadR/GntR family transcriptional regulator n=1 Tax=Glycomyces sp. NRRL B-16210 TaxID=1463821 RepID=UPI0004C0108A|nr:FadR/GntR family transcriptional regulator [Glycomyces sp. NRRL B-16210]